MSALSVIRAGVIGVAAVVAPAVTLGVASLSAYSRNMMLLWVMFGVSLLLVGGLAWTCVRVARFPPWLAVFLTTISFDLLLLLAIPVRYGDSGGAFFIYLVPFALAMLIAWWAGCRLATRSNPSPRAPRQFVAGDFD